MIYRKISTPIDSKLAWIRLSLVCLMCLIGCVGMWSVVIIMPAIQTEFKIDRSVTTIPYILTMLGFGLGNVFVGKYVDKYGIIKPIIFAFISLIIVYFISIFATNIMILSFFQFILGFSSATFFGPMMADITKFFAKKKGLAVSMVASSQHLAGATWPFLLHFFLSDGNWRIAHIFIGVFCFITVPPLCYFIFKMKLENQEQVLNKDANFQINFKLPISNKSFQILLMIAGVGCCVSMSTPQVHIIPLCIDNGYNLEIGTNILSIMLFCAAVSRIIYGYIADKIGPLETLLLASSLQAITIFMYIPFNDLTSLYIISILFGLVQGGIVPSYALIISKYLPKNEVAERVGLVILMTVIGMSIGGWMSGKIFDLTNSYTLGFLNSFVWNISNIIIIVIIFLMIKKSDKKLHV